MSHQTISDPDHVTAAKVLRRTRIGLVRPAAEPDVQIRCLDDYDTLLGITGDNNDTGDTGDHDVDAPEGGVA